jgi:hypothetical protein
MRRALTRLYEVVRQTQSAGSRVLLCDLGATVREAVAASPVGQLIGGGELELTFEDALHALGPTGEYRTSEHPARPPA